MAKDNDRSIIPDQYAHRWESPRHGYGVGAYAADGEVVLRMASLVSSFRVIAGRAGLQVDVAFSPGAARAFLEVVQAALADADAKMSEPEKPVTGDLFAQAGAGEEGGAE